MLWGGDSSVGSQRPTFPHMVEVMTGALKTHLQSLGDVC